MTIPLENRLKKRAQARVARLQDELVDLLYAVDDRLVLHGGTAIWRCYRGNRFSEDIDMYGRDPVRLSSGLRARAEQRGLSILKSRQTRNMLFIKVRDDDIEVRVEVNLSVAPAPVVASFERADGSRMDVLTLTPDQLVGEKIAAYKSRRLIRDIYDIHHLLPIVEDIDSLRPALRSFLADLPKPLDEANLRALVYSGVSPGFPQIVASIRRIAQ